MYNNNTSCGRIPCQKINVNINTTNSEHPEEHHINKINSVLNTLCYILKKVTRSFKTLLLIMFLLYIILNFYITNFHTSSIYIEESLHYIKISENYYYIRKSDLQIHTISSNHKNNLKDKALQHDIETNPGPFSKTDRQEILQMVSTAVNAAISTLSSTIKKNPLSSKVNKKSNSSNNRSKSKKSTSNNTNKKTL